MLLQDPASYGIRYIRVIIIVTFSCVILYIITSNFDLKLCKEMRLLKTIGYRRVLSLPLDWNVFQWFTEFFCNHFCFI